MNQMHIHTANGNTSRFQKLLPEQCEEIFSAALRILERTGCEIKSTKAKEVLLSAGAKEINQRVCIPSFLVKKALNSAPKQILIYNTKGELALCLNPSSEKSYWGTGMESRFTIDRHTGEQRLTTYNDAVETGLVIQALENIDIATGMCYISDRKAETSQLYECRALLETTLKPILLLQSNLEAFKTELKLFATITGGLEEFLAHPCLISGVSQAVPLKFEENIAKIVMTQWELGLPAIYGTTTSMGVSAPITLAGALAMGLADNLMALVLSQEIHPGCPFIASTGMSPFDMVNMTTSISGAHFMLAQACNADIFRYIGLPYTSILGGTDAPVFNHQAAADMAQQFLLGTLCQSSCNLFTGFLEASLSSSLESLVYCNELIETARRLTQPIEVNADTLAEDLINKTVASGNFLSTDHTIYHYQNYGISHLDRETYFIYNDKNAEKESYNHRVKWIDQIVEAGSQIHRDPKLLKELDQIIKTS